MYKIIKKQRLFDYDNPIVNYEYKIVKQPKKRKREILKVLSTVFGALLLGAFMYILTIFMIIISPY